MPRKMGKAAAPDADHVPLEDAARPTREQMDAFADASAPIDRAKMQLSQSRHSVNELLEFLQAIAEQEGDDAQGQHEAAILSHAIAALYGPISAAAHALIALNVRMADAADAFERLAERLGEDPSS